MRVDCLLELAWHRFATARENTGTHHSRDTFSKQARSRFRFQSPTATARSLGQGEAAPDGASGSSDPRGVA